MESGSWIVLGTLLVAFLMAYFGRTPRRDNGIPTESLGKRWFGSKQRVS